MSLATGFTTSRFNCVALSMMLLVAVGCSGRPKNFANKVTGKVTLGGQPLAGAMVMFTPIEDGTPSAGRTNEAGEYNLVWAQQRRRTIEGAQIGEHSVKISTFVDAVPSLKRAGVAEKVPFKYRVDAPPKVTVKAGANVIDIPLEAGPVDAPVAKGKGKKK